MDGTERLLRTNRRSFGTSGATNAAEGINNETFARGSRRPVVEDKRELTNEFD